MIKYVEGDLFSHVALRAQDEDKNFILIPHVCNDIGAWGAGFVIPLGRVYPDAQTSYRKLFELQAGELGYTDFVRVTNHVFVANMIAQHGVGGKRPLRYNHLAKCLADVAEYAERGNMEIHAPMFGSGLSGGNWDTISDLITDSWANLDVTIYYLNKDALSQHTQQEYPVTDLVITKADDGKYHVRGGPEDAIFDGRGINHDEALGSWLRQNRERVNFMFSFVEDGKFTCSTVHGAARTKDQLGPNELKALSQFKNQ